MNNISKLLALSVLFTGIYTQATVETEYTGEEQEVTRTRATTTQTILLNSVQNNTDNDYVLRLRGGDAITVAAHTTATPGTSINMSETRGLMIRIKQQNSQEERGAIIIRNKGNTGKLLCRCRFRSEANGNTNNTETITYNQNQDNTFNLDVVLEPGFTTSTVTLQIAS